MQVRIQYHTCELSCFELFVIMQLLTTVAKLGSRTRTDAGFRYTRCLVNIINQNTYCGIIAKRLFSQAYKLLVKCQCVDVCSPVYRIWICL